LAAYDRAIRPSIGLAITRGDDEVLTLLNEQLAGELTAINQSLLHTKMQAN
jgi:hypothetical protein